MPDRLRFHLDENVDPDIARALRRHGIDVTTTHDAGLYSRSDQTQLDFARSERRVIVTHDTDFLRMAAASSEHPGIAYCHQASRPIGSIIESLVLMYEILAPDEVLGRIEFV